MIGFDIDDAKIADLNNNNNGNIEFTSDPSKMKEADFVLIAVPTPVTKSRHKWTHISLYKKSDVKTYLVVVPDNNFSRRELS